MKLNPENRPFYRRSDDLSDFEILMNILNVFYWPKIRPFWVFNGSYMLPS